nr:MAG TPA: hypothetical protein [Caudoviricetes sp.]
MRARAGCGRLQARKRGQYAPQRGQMQPELELKDRSYSITEVSCTPADITGSIMIIAWDSTDVFRSQLCNKNIC